MVHRFKQQTRMTLLASSTILQHLSTRLFRSSIRTTLSSGMFTISSSITSSSSSSSPKNLSSEQMNQVISLRASSNKCIRYSKISSRTIDHRCHTAPTLIILNLTSLLSISLIILFTTKIRRAIRIFRLAAIILARVENIALIHKAVTTRWIRAAISYLRVITMDKSSTRTAQLVLWNHSLSRDSCNSKRISSPMELRMAMIRWITSSCRSRLLRTFQILFSLILISNLYSSRTLE